VDALLVVQPDRTVLHVRLGQVALTEVAGRFRRLAAAFVAGRTRVPYAPAFTPELDEIMVIEAYPLPPELAACGRALARALPTASERVLQVSPPNAFVLIETGESPRLIFQTITSANRLTPKRAVFFGPQDFKLNEDPGLLFGHRVNAIIEDGNLLFTSEHTVRHFLDLDAYFQEATDDALDAFFAKDAFEVGDMSALKGAANQVLRRKLQRVIQTGKLPSPKTLQAAAKKYLGLKLTIRGKALVVPTDAKEFGKFVRLLNHDYVQSVTDTMARFVTSSKRPLPIAQT
jgi:hypothetical protein